VRKPRSGSAGGDAITEIVRRLVTTHPDAPARTLARRLVDECNGALTLEQARTRIRTAFGRVGKKQARWAVAPRPPRQAGEVFAMPPSVARPWVPCRFPVTGRVGVLSDAHVPYHDDQALAAAVSHLKRAGLAGLLINGDWADFYAVSRHEKNPKDRDFRGELKAVRESLQWIRQEFPGIPIVYKLGNHEERWQRWLWQHAVEISDEPEMGLDVWLKTQRLGIEIVEDQRIVMVGELPVLHGHELPRGLSSPVNAARGAFLRTHHTVLVGHSHQTSGHCDTDLFHRETFVWSTGCLCALTPEYARINRWNHGCAVVEVHDDGQFDVSNLRIAKGVVRTS